MNKFITNEGFTLCVSFINLQLLKAKMLYISYYVVDKLLKFYYIVPRISSNMLDVCTYQEFL